MKHYQPFSLAFTPSEIMTARLVAADCLLSEVAEVLKAYQQDDISEIDIAGIESLIDALDDALIPFR
jgi:hypothetical protein